MFSSRFFPYFAYALLRVILILPLRPSAMDIEERIEIRADLIYTGILDAVERLKNQSVDVFMEQVCTAVHPCTK